MGTHLHFPHPPKDNLAFYCAAMHQSRLLGDIAGRRQQHQADTLHELHGQAAGERAPLRRLLRALRQGQQAQRRGAQSGPVAVAQRGRQRQEDPRDEEACLARVGPHARQAGLGPGHAFLQRGGHVGAGDAAPQHLRRHLPRAAGAGQVRLAQAQDGGRQGGQRRPLPVAQLRVEAGQVKGDQDEVGEPEQEHALCLPQVVHAGVVEAGGALRASQRELQVGEGMS